MSRRLTAFVLCFGLASLSNGPLAALSAAPRADAGAEAAVETDRDVAEALAFLDARPTALTEAELREVARTVVVESRRVGIAPRIILALIHVESSGHNFAVSHAGAMGLMQLLPPTAEAVALRSGIPWRGPQTLFDPVANVRLGVRYLATLVERFDHLPTALAAYNWGPTHIAQRLRDGDPIPVRYSKRVLTTYRGSWKAARPA